MKRQDNLMKHNYNINAAFSGGQILNLETSDLSQLGEFVGFSADQSQVTILRESGNMSTTFHVDSFIQQVVISIDGSGGGENVSVMTPTGNDMFYLISLNLQLCANIILCYFLSRRCSCIHLEYDAVFSVTTDILFFHSHLDNQ